MTSNMDSIKQNNKNLPNILNGPEGSISHKTYESIKLLEWGLTQLRTNLERYGKYEVNLLSCMTLDIEHLHSTVNYKQGLQTMLQYAHSFASSVKESLKSITQWSTYYYTNKEGWYPLPENSMDFKEIQMPKPLPSNKMSLENKEKMREWTSANGRAVRQRTVRQETTMAKAGTLPESCYHQEYPTLSIREKKQILMTL